MTVPRGQPQWDSLTNPILITAIVHIRPEGHREPRNEFESLSPAERLVGFEPGTLRFLLQPLNPLGHNKFDNEWCKTNHDVSGLFSKCLTF